MLVLARVVSQFSPKLLPSPEENFGHFFEQARERGVNYVTSFTKFDWSVIFSSRSKHGTCENEYSRASDKANI